MGFVINIRSAKPLPKPRPFRVPIDRRDGRLYVIETLLALPDDISLEE